MRVRNAQKIAAEWVLQHASHKTGYQGAYFSGSTIGLSTEDELPTTSDIDVVIVTKQDDSPLKLGKFIYQGILVEVTYLPLNQLSSVEEVLASYHLAGSFRVDTIIDDPTGYLRILQVKVSSHFAERTWVHRRCEDARERIENGLRAIDPLAPFHDQITSWLFPTGVTTHVLLVAALQNPTVRLRYLAVQKVLIEYGHASFYQDLLQLLGCVHMSPQRVEHHLDALSRTFDAAVEVAKTPFFFSTDISAQSRLIAIEGSRHLIKTGNHLEAVFWIVATFARCHKILAADATLELQQSLFPAFEAIVADLGINSTNDLNRRAEDVINFLPKLWEIVEEILIANPGITEK